MRSISLQVKLIALVSVVTVLMTGLIVAYHAESLQQSVRETFNSQLTGITTAINGRYEESRSVEDIQQIFDYIQLKNPDVLELTLHVVSKGDNGEVAASTDRTKIKQPSPSYVKGTLMQGKTLVDPNWMSRQVPSARLIAPLEQDGQTVGAIELLLNASVEEDLIHNQVTTSILVGFLCSVGFLIVLWFTLRKMLVKPLLQLREAAIAVKNGEQAQKINLNASLELTEVGDAFNDMVENLQKRYNELQQTQEQLVQSEKMVALGRLVAGVAHEINTPIGVGVTAVSYLAQRTHEFHLLYEQSRMKKSDLEAYLKTTLDTVDIVQTNLRRASELIKSFKQVSVDQSSEERRKFRLLDYIEDIVRSLNPTIRKTKQRVVIRGDRGIEVDTYPGVVSQIVTNLIMNSLIHAYEPEQEGYMLVSAEFKPGRLVVQYADDGKGMSKEVADKIFDPFFTTNRSRGGTGLGMHIVYNLVTQKLGGTIQCVSEVGRGTTFIMDIPIAQEATYDNRNAG